MSTTMTDAVHDLVHPWTDVVTTDGRTNYRAIDHDPLLVMLRRAIRSSTGKTDAGRSDDNARSLIDPAAFDLWQRLTIEVRDHTRRYTRDNPNPMLGYAITSLAANVDALWNTNQITEADYTHLVRRARSWRHQIWELFDRVREVEITAPCPRCEQVKVTNHDGDIQSALFAFYRKGIEPAARCRHCGWVWQGQAQLVILGKMIGADLDNDTLVEMGVI